MWTACLPTLGPGLIDGASPLPGERSGIEFTEGLCRMCDVCERRVHTRAVGQASSRCIFVAGLVYILFIVVFFDVVLTLFILISLSDFDRLTIDVCVRIAQ